MEKRALDRIFDFIMGKIGEESRKRGKINLQSVILHEIGRAVRISEVSEEKTLQLIAESMLQVFPVSKIVIYLYDRKGGYYTGRIGAGILDKRLLDIRVPRDFVYSFFNNKSSVVVNVEDLPDNWKTVSDLLGRKVLFLPLIEGENIMGFLLVETHDDPDRLSNEERRLIEYFAFIMSGVLHNAEMVASLKRKTERLEALSEIVKALTSTLDIKRLLNLIVEKAIELTESTSGSLILIDKESKKLIIKAYRGLPAGTENLKLDIGEGITGLVARDGKSRLVNDVEADPDYVVANPDVKSEMAVPLVKDGEVIGVLNVDKTEKNAYDEDDLRLLEMLAGSATIALTNAMMFGKCAEEGDED